MDEHTHSQHEDAFKQILDSGSLLGVIIIMQGVFSPVWEQYLRSHDIFTTYHCEYPGSYSDDDSKYMEGRSDEKGHHGKFFISPRRARLGQSEIDRIIRDELGARRMINASRLDFLRTLSRDMKFAQSWYLYDYSGLFDWKLTSEGPIFKRFGIVDYIDDPHDQGIGHMFSTTIADSRASNFAINFFDGFQDLCAPSTLVGEPAPCIWVPIRRGTRIPENAVIGGHTTADGKTWVGRYHGEAGKITGVASDPAPLMYNFWGHHKGQHETAEILCANRKYSWCHIQHGDMIACNSVEVGSTRTDGVNYVGKAVDDGTVGKINTALGEMHKFWGHGRNYSRGEKTAELLVIDTGCV